MEHTYEWYEYLISALLLIGSITVLLKLPQWLQDTTEYDKRTDSWDFSPPGYPLGWGRYANKPALPEERLEGYFEVGQPIWMKTGKDWHKGHIDYVVDESDTVRALCDENKCTIKRHTLVVGRQNTHLWPKHRFPSPEPIGTVWGF